MMQLDEIINSSDGIFLNLRIMKIIGEITEKEAILLRSYVSLLCSHASKPFFVDLNLDIDGNPFEEELKSMAFDQIDGIFIRESLNIKLKIEYISKRLLLNKARNLNCKEKEKNLKIMRLATKASFVIKAVAIVILFSDINLTLFVAKLKPICPIIVPAKNNEDFNYLGLISGVYPVDVEGELTGQEFLNKKTF